ncbi:unnamed protein product [Meganyctiphanes norvegica]|uniref:Carbohydrate sulfotransferase n=1 Tax=Meganyctiphanes norvegica TaxID=48144 RepID=A0AAV2Q7K6_MEGNR
MNFPPLSQVQSLNFSRTRYISNSLDEDNPNISRRNIGGNCSPRHSMMVEPRKWQTRVKSFVLQGNARLWFLAVIIYCGLGLILNDSNNPNALLDLEDEQPLIEWVQENEQNLRKEYSERQKLAHSVCEDYDIYMAQDEYIRKADRNEDKLQYQDWFTLKRVNWNYMYYVPGEDFVYCKVPKSGSSTWVYNLLKLANVPQEQISSDIGLHKLLRDHYPKMSSSSMKRVFKKSFKLLVVRHPFERILSAYRDKLEDYQRDLMFRDGYYYTMYGKNIVRVYRDQQDISLANHTEPTWREFVRYLANTPSSKFDEHWKPTYSLCSPCIVKYDVIAKMETFSEDTQFVINQLGLEDQLTVEWVHRTAKETTTEVAKKYYSQLTKAQVDQLFNKYRLDFELFGYYPEEYREMAQE